MRYAVLCVILGVVCGLSRGGEPFDFSVASARRVDVVMIGDSNQVLGGHGWDEGYAAVLSERYGQFATGLFSVGENQGNGSGSGYGARVLWTTGRRNVRYQVGPEALQRYLHVEREYHYANSLEVFKGRIGSLPGPGMTVSSGSALHHDSRLRFWYSYGTYPYGSGRFCPTIRRDVPPYDVIARSDPIQTLGAWGAHIGWLDAESSESGARDDELGFYLYNNQSPLVSPAIFYYVRVEDRTLRRGTSVSTLCYSGGVSSRGVAVALRTMKDDMLGLYFDHIVRANRTGEIVVRICEGYNDLHEPSRSVGPAGVVPGNSGAAFADNTVAMIDRLRGLFERRGYGVDRLHFVITTPPPTSTPNDPMLLAYEQAAAGIPLLVPDASVRVVVLSSLTTAEEIESSGYRLEPESPYHLTRPGYIEMARREIDALTN